MGGWKQGKGASHGGRWAWGRVGGGGKGYREPEKDWKDRKRTSADSTARDEHNPSKQLAPGNTQAYKPHVVGVLRHHAPHYEEYAADLLYAYYEREAELLKESLKEAQKLVDKVMELPKQSQDLPSPGLAVQRASLVLLQITLQRPHPLLPQKHWPLSHWRTH